MADPAKILVVDDEPDTVGLLELTLRTAGYEIQSARSGQEGLRLALEEAFDLLLLDVMMPDLTGFDLMRSLQELHGASEKAPVVILTARDRPEDREIGQRLGAVGYLLKPATRWPTGGRHPQGARLVPRPWRQRLTSSSPGSPPLSKSCRPSSSLPTFSGRCILRRPARART